MKIAITTIAKNEEANVEAFIASCKDADVISVLDTGSTDRTVELLQKHNAFAGISIIEPFDFSEARNHALEALPSDVDIAISIDLDERLQPGWRESLEKAWGDDIDAISYWYIGEWADEAKTIPATEAWRTKIFDPKVMKWFRLIHETPLLKNGDQPRTRTCRGVEVWHFQNGERDYSEALSRLIDMNPDDEDAYIQRASEWMKMDENKKALNDFKMYLEKTFRNDCANPKCPRCELISGRRAFVWIDIAKIKHNMGASPDEIMKCFLHAAAECPNLREAWTYLADGWFAIGDYGAAYAAAIRASSIVNSGIHAKDGKCWGDLPGKIANDSLKELLINIKKIT